MDKNGKIFGKLSIIDAIAIVFLLIVCAGIIYRYASPNAKVSTSDEKITYVLQIEGVRDFTGDYYTKEDNLKCFDSKNNELIGVIKDVEIRPYKKYSLGLDGVPRWIERPETITVYLTIEADGRETDDAYYIGGTYKLRIGGEIYLATKYSSVVTTVVAINGKDYKPALK